MVDDWLCVWFRPSFFSGLVWSGDGWVFFDEVGWLLVVVVVGCCWLMVWVGRCGAWFQLVWTGRLIVWLEDFLFKMGLVG